APPDPRRRAHGGGGVAAQGRGRRPLEPNEPDVVDTGDAFDGVELLLGGRLIDGDEHERPAATTAAHLHRLDVDIELAEEDADAADHPGAVFVVAGEEVGAALGREVHIQAVDED